MKYLFKVEIIGSGGIHNLEYEKEVWMRYTQYGEYAALKPFVIFLPEESEEAVVSAFRLTCINRVGLKPQDLLVTEPVPLNYRIHLPVKDWPSNPLTVSPGEQATWMEGLMYVDHDWSAGWFGKDRGSRV